MLGAILLFRSEIIGREGFRFLVITGLSIYIVALIAFLNYWSKTVRLSGKMTIIKKAAYIALFSSVFIVVAGLILSIFHYHVIGKQLVVAGLFIFIVGFSMLIPATLSALRRNRVILHPIYYRCSTVFNVVAYVSILLCMGGMLLKMFHYPEGRSLLWSGLALLIIGVYGVLLYLKMKIPIFSTKKINVTLDELNEYAGSYHNEEIKMDINMLGRSSPPALMLQLNGLPGFPLVANEQDIFSFRWAGIIIEFGSGKDEFILKQGDRQFKFRKQ